jgi:hypothetical protein
MGARREWELEGCITEATSLISQVNAPINCPSFVCIHKGRFMLKEEKGGVWNVMRMLQTQVAYNKTRLEQYGYT